MTKDRYLDMQEQLGKDPDPERCPPAAEDFPEVLLDAISIFNMLGDRVYPEIGYVGKDYTNLPILIEVMQVDNKELLLDALARLDGHAIQKSQERLKREYDKLKRKK
jgi:hypothetical protein